MRLQQEKKQLETGKEAQSKTSTVLIEHKTNKQRLQEDIRKAREEVTKFQPELAVTEARRVDEVAKSTEHLNQICRIAPEYKKQLEKLKAVHDLCPQVNLLLLLKIKTIAKS